jgi:hypothetical protein
MPCSDCTPVVSITLQPVNVVRAASFNALIFSASLIFKILNNHHIRDFVVKAIDGQPN